jgi:hypothetical protein
MFSQDSDGAVPVTASRAKRENGGLGEDPPGGTMTYHHVLRTWMFSQGSYGAVPMTARRAKRENGGLGEDPPGDTMTYYQVLRTWMFSQGSYGCRIYKDGMKRSLPSFELLFQRKPPDHCYARLVRTLFAFV